MVNSFLIKGASLEAVSKKGMTPLHIASLLGNDEVVQILLNVGANFEARAECVTSSDTPLHVACQHGYLAVVKLLVENGADLDAKNGDGYTPESLAESRGKFAIARFLKEKKEEASVQGSSQLKF
jgi:ankyrin repeat protein